MNFFETFKLRIKMDSAFISILQIMANMDKLCLLESISKEPYLSICSTKPWEPIISYENWRNYIPTS